jgi:hypothetical protein
VLTDQGADPDQSDEVAGIRDASASAAEREGGNDQQFVAPRGHQTDSRPAVPEDEDDRIQ